jgi:hypothetical protein
MQISLSLQNRCQVAIKDDAPHAHEYVKLFIVFGKRFVSRIISNPSKELVEFVKCLLNLTGSDDLDGK